MDSIDPYAQVADLTRSVVDIASVSGQEDRLATCVQRSLEELAHLTVTRSGNVVLARSELGSRERVVIAGHLDTVPEAGNLPSRREDGRIYGLGACDMKGGVAVALRLAATVPEPARDVTYCFYDCEEVEASRNGLGRIARERPELLTADLGILMEPSCADVEAGCQGTLRVEVRVRGQRAHSARSWMGENAVHAAAGVLGRLAAYEPREVKVDGLTYREGLNAVGISGGVAGNVIPDECRIRINHRFAPDRTEAEALAHVRETLAGYEVELTDTAPAAAPGLSDPGVAAFVAATGATPQPKLGWTDVARLASLGIPALNYGPGDPSLAHTPGEYVEIEELERCEQRLRAWLTR